MKIEFCNTIIDKIQTMKDGGLKLTLITRELPASEKLKIFQLLEQEGDIQIENPMTETDSKTPSQRLRNVLHVLWSQEYKQTYASFDVFYATRMEQLINQIKDKLN